MTPNPSPTQGINVEEELVGLRQAVENLEHFDPDTDPLSVITFLGDIEATAGRARIALEGRLG